MLGRRRGRGAGGGAIGGDGGGHRRPRWASVAVADSVPSPSVTEQNDVVYATVDGAPVLLDAFLPNTAAKKRPAVVLVHGGGWASGDKTSFVDEARLLAQRGLRRLLAGLPPRARAPVSRGRRRRARRDPLAAPTRAGRRVPHRSRRRSAPSARRRARTWRGSSPPSATVHSPGARGSASRSRIRARWTSPSRATRTRR